MKKPTFISVNKKFIYGLLKNRYLSSHDVYVSKHFLERYNQRQIAPEDVKKLVYKLADNICQVIYSFNIGKSMDIELGPLVMKLGWDNRVIIKTCFDRRNRQ